MAEKGGNLRPDDVEIERTTRNKLELCSDAADRAAQVREARSRREGVLSSLTVISTESPAAMKEEDSNPGVHESMDVAEVHFRASPNDRMSQLFFLLPCIRQYYVSNPWSLLLSSGAKTLSAGLYLFDYVSNILVLWQYYILYKTRYLPGVNKDPLSARTLAPFYVCLGLMISDPVVAAVAFKLKLPPQEHPLRSAFFLPIVQFQRFVVGIFKTGSCASAFETTESLETEALFAIMSAIETAPQLILQFTIIAVVSIERNSKHNWRPPAILMISIIASFLSASYNAGRAVMYRMSKRWTFTLNVSGIFGGMYTFGALLLRCTAVASLIFGLSDDFLGVYYIRTRILIRTLYFAVGICLFSYVNGLLVLLSKGRDMWSWAAQVEIIVAAYMSATIGPIYPVIENDSGDQARPSKIYTPKYTLCVRLALAVGIYMLPDVLVLLSLALKFNTTSCKLGRFSGYRYYRPSNALTCHQLIGYVATGVALSILPCIILPYLVRSGSKDKCEGHSVPVLISTRTRVEDKV